MKYADAYGVACGTRAVIVANSDSAYPCRAALRAAGIEIAALDRTPDIVAAELDTRGLRIVTGSALAAVCGGHAVRGCSIAGRRTGCGLWRERIDCDLILNAGGFAPAVHLHSQAGGKLRWLEEAAMFVPGRSRPRSLISVGACAGVFEPRCNDRRTRGGR